MRSLSETVTTLLEQFHLRWGIQQKLVFLCYMLAVDVFVYFVWFVFVSFYTPIHTDIALDKLSVFGWITGCYALVLAILGKKLSHRRVSKSTLLAWQIGIMGTYAFYVLYVTHLLGQFSVVAGVSMMAGVIVMLFFVQRLVVYLMVIGGFITFFTFLMLSSYGVLDYAALIKQPRHATGLFWVVSFFYLIAFKLMVAYVFVDTIVNRLKAHFRQVQFLSEHDGLTGLLNRRMLQVKATDAIERYDDVALLFIDIDHFKQINDKHGHMAGDTVIRRVATYLQQYSSAQHAVGRYGGEEFVMVLADVNDAEAKQHADKLCEGISTLNISDKHNQHISVSVSVGLTTLQAVRRSRPQLTDATELLYAMLQQADDALYRAKDSGRNRVVLAEVL